METINKEYTLTEAYTVLKQKAEKFDWEIVGELPDVPGAFPSRNQEKKYLSALKQACKKGTRRAFNNLFYKMPGANVKINLGVKERAIQSKRKAWLKLRDEADKALAAYKEEKGDFYKNILK